MKAENYNYRVVMEIDFKKTIYSGKEEIGLVPSTYMEVIVNIDGVIPHFIEIVENEMAKRLIPMTLDVDRYLSSYYLFKIETTPDFKDEVRVSLDEVINHAKEMHELIHTENEERKDLTNAVEVENFKYFDEVIANPTGEGADFTMFEVPEEGEVNDG